MITFNMEFCSQKVIQHDKKVADEEELCGILVRRDIPREERERNGIQSESINGRHQKMLESKTASFLA